MPFLRCLGAPGSLPELRKHFDFLDLMRPYAQRLMRGPSPLSEGERELIAAYVSALNQCRYCLGSHVRVAEGFGMDAAVLDQLLVSVADAPVPAPLKPLLLYVQILTQTPSRLTADDANVVFAAGWSDEALMHAVAVCAYFNNMNRLVEGTGITGSDAIYELSAKNLVERGYLP